MKMVSQNTQRQFINQSQFNLSPLNIIATLCLFSVVFLGLKVWWFRAKIQFGDIRPKKKEKDTVQGIGIKLNTNPEMRQIYKSISEFAPVDIDPIRNEGHLQSENMKTARDNVHRILQESRMERNPVNMTKNDLKPVEQGSPASVNKHKRTEPIINDFICDVPVKHDNQTLQVKNPLATPTAQNVMKEKEEHEIRIDPTAPKYDTLRFENINNNQNQSRMYSHEAASIFYGNTDDNTPSPPLPKPRKFLEDLDYISLNGTNA